MRTSPLTVAPVISTRRRTSARRNSSDPPIEVSHAFKHGEARLDEIDLAVDAGAIDAKIVGEDGARGVDARPYARVAQVDCVVDAFLEEQGPFDPDAQHQDRPTNVRTVQRDVLRAAEVGEPQDLS